MIKKIKLNKFRREKFICFNLTKSVNTITTSPQNLAELQEYLEIAKKQNLKIAIKAAGNSYSDVFLISNQLIIDISNLDSIKSFDSENGFVVVEPGVRIGNLLKIIMPKNWGLVGLSGSVTDLVSGMLSSNTHGKDTWKNGNFSQNVLSFKLLLANGKIEEVSRQKNAELFNGVIGGLGFLGIVVEITLKLNPIKSFMVKSSTKRICNFDDLIEHFYTLEKSGSDFSYALLDAFSSDESLGKGICESSMYVDAPKCSDAQFEEFLSPKRKIGFLKPEIFWSTIRPFWGNAACSLVNKLRFFRSQNDFIKSSIEPFPKIQYGYSALPKFNLLYAPSGFFELQSLFPRENAISAFMELLSVSNQFKSQPWICMIKRHKPDTSYLTFSGDGLSIAMNFSLKHLNSNLREKYCNKLFETIIKFNGKIYISKHAIIPKSIFQKMYPDFKKIINLKNNYDPDFVFSSDATNRLLLEN